MEQKNKDSQWESNKQSEEAPLVLINLLSQQTFVSFIHVGVYASGPFGVVSDRACKSVG